MQVVSRVRPPAPRAQGGPSRPPSVRVVPRAPGTERGRSELQFVSKQGRQASRNRAGKPDPMRSPALESRTGTSVGSGVEGHAEQEPRETVAKTARIRGGVKGD